MPTPQRIACFLAAMLVPVQARPTKALAENPVAYVTLNPLAYPLDTVLESGMRINVSRINVNWNTRWNDAAGYRVLRWRYDCINGYRSYVVGRVSGHAEFDSRSAALWVTKARADVESLILNVARQRGIELKLVDRANLGDRLNEADLEIADIVESTPARRRSKSLAVDARINADIDVDVHLQTGNDTTISGIYAGYRPCGWRWYTRLDYSQRRSIRRIITFQARFSLEDAVTGQIWVSHASSWQPIDTARPHRVFGADQGLMDFDRPDDELVMAFLNREIPSFVAKLMPTRSPQVVRVESSGNTNCQRGVRLLAIRDNSGAYAALSQAIIDHPDDVEAHFAAGLACEFLGSVPLACSHYRAAIRYARSRDVSRYRERLALLEDSNTQSPRSLQDR